MSKVLVSDGNLTNIANSIRSKLGVQTTYKPNQMSAAIDSIETGININGVVREYTSQYGISEGRFVQLDKRYATGNELTFSTNGLRKISTVVLSENKVAVAYIDSSGSYYYARVKVFDINDGVITQAATQFWNMGTIGSNTGLSLVRLSSSQLFVAYGYGSSGYLYGKVLTISDSSISEGTAVALSSTTNAGRVISAVALSSTSVFIAHSYGSNQYLYGIVCTISGTTITAGTDTALVSTAGAGAAISATNYSFSNVFIAHSSDTTNYYLNGIACTISSTTITKGSDISQLSSSTNMGQSFSAQVLHGGSSYYTVLVVGAGSLTQGHIVRVSTSNRTYVTKFTNTIETCDRYCGISIVPLRDFPVDYDHRDNYVAMFFYYNNNLRAEYLNIYDDCYFSRESSTMLQSSDGARYYISAVYLNPSDVFIAYPSNSDGSELSVQVARRSVSAASDIRDIAGVTKNSANSGSKVQVITL